MLRVLAMVGLLACLGLCPVKLEAATARAAEAEQARLPPERHSLHQGVFGGRSIQYRAAAGALPMKDPSGRLLGEMAYVAYSSEGSAPGDRPITFVFGGGPGYSVGSLHLRMAGPKIIRSANGTVISGEPPVLEDNQDSWLEFTDLVFVDPVGVGWSRLASETPEAEKRFFGWKQDIQWLSRFVADYLLHSGRLSSPKYLAGESYGGFRVPQIGHQLQMEQGIGIAGMIMISPVIDFSLRLSRNGPMNWATLLPVMAAARMERDSGGDVDVAQLDDVHDYAFGEYLRDLMRPRSDEAAQARLARNVARITGLAPDLVRGMNGRIDPATFNRNLRRRQGLVGSRYDASGLAFDPFSERAEYEWVDPSADSVAPVVTAVTDYVTNVIGWRPGLLYRYADRTISKKWDYPAGRVDATVDLRNVLAIDPKLELIVAHGATDFVTPYLASRIILDQFPPEMIAGRVSLNLYPGGHGFYERPASRAKFRHDVRALYTRGAGAPARSAVR
jgi:carboxypeptidase C (cathepsin A)